MSGSAKVALRTQVGGQTFLSNVERVDELETVFTRSMPAGRVATLTTRTDNAIGVLTTLTGHGIVTNDRVSVFSELGYRFSSVVTATTATTITLSAGAGDNLPVVTTPVVMSKEETHNLAITGDQLALLVIDTDVRASANFRNAALASLLAYDLRADEGRLWIKSMGVVNPLATLLVATLVIGNGSILASEFKLGLLTSSNG